MHGSYSQPLHGPCSRWIFLFHVANDSLNHFILNGTINLTDLRHVLNEINSSELPSLLPIAVCDGDRNEGRLVLASVLKPS